VPHHHAAQPEEDLVRLYLHDIGKYALLAKDDEARLAQAIETGREARTEFATAERTTPARQRELRRLTRDGDQAAETFVNANLRLVVSIAKKYRAAELPLLDLVQDGNLGLIHAVEKFDWRRGFKFSTYATWWIRQAISRGIENTGRTIRLPVHASDLLTRVTEARGRLEDQLGRRPTVPELAGDLEVGEDRVTDILRHTGQPRSLSEPLGQDGDAELGDVMEDRTAISPFDAAAATLLAGEIDKMLLTLDGRERQILRLRFGLDRGEARTLDQVGKHFSLSRERIRQIEDHALLKLRHPSTDRQPHQPPTGHHHPDPNLTTDCANRSARQRLPTT
jgi:RNA polymerase sigma factor (sigma-70 family)